MAKLSDSIEYFLKDLLDQTEDNNLIIRRNELADKFKCAPSQINYVLTTRFTYEKGYLIESRRGGGGYIVIKKVIHEVHADRWDLIYDEIGTGITYHNAAAIVDNLLEHNIIDEKAANLTKVAINDRTLQSSKNINETRADIFKALLMVLLK